MAMKFWCPIWQNTKFFLAKSNLNFVNFILGFHEISIVRIWRNFDEKKLLQNSKTLPTVYCPLPTLYCLLPSPLFTAIRCPLSTAYCLLPTVHCQLSHAHCSLPTVYCPLFFCPLPIVHCFCLLPNAHCLLSTAHCPVSTTHCFLPTVCCPSFTALFLLTTAHYHRPLPTTLTESVSNKSKSKIYFFKAVAC